MALIKKGRERLALAYLALQAIIWAKSALFYILYGHGKVLPFSEAAFPADAIAFDWWFHLAGHAAIGLLAFAFGWKAEKIKWKGFAAVIFAAVALHNFAYWLTASHPGTVYSVIDFASDSAILAIFVLAGHAARGAMGKKGFAPAIFLFAEELSVWLSFLFAA